MRVLGAGFGFRMSIHGAVFGGFRMHRQTHHHPTLTHAPTPTPSLQGLAVTFVAGPADSEVLNQVQERFDVDIKPLPEHVDAGAYMNAAA
jgi:hypothetical protein